MAKAVQEWAAVNTDEVFFRYRRHDADGIESNTSEGKKFMSKKNAKKAAAPASTSTALVPAGQAAGQVELTGDRRLSASGRDLGMRYNFLPKPVSEIKRELREKGLRGNEVKRLVNEALATGGNMAWLMHDAFTSMARSRGMVPQNCDVNKSGTRATARFVSPEVIKTSEPKPVEITAETVAQMTDEQRQLALDLLLGLKK